VLNVVHCLLRDQLQVPRIKMTTYGSRAAVHAGPSTWNALPNTLKCSSHCLPTFRCSGLLQITRTHTHTHTHLYSP